MSKLNLKLYFKKRKQRLSVFGISIACDWRFIVGIATLVLLAGIGYATLLYIQINNDSLFESVEDENPKIEIEQKKLEIQKTSEMLQQRSFDESVVN